MFKAVLPKVDFIAMEHQLLDFWYSQGIIKKYLAKNNQSKSQFSFLDGPITANNPMGVHHAWGRTYKDLWQRFFTMLGKKQRYQNGFDEQGLWVEVEVEKELGLKSKKDIENLVPGDKFKSLEKFINLCKDRVKKFSAIQTEQSQRLGYFMDWDNSYHTSSDENNYSIWNYLATVHKKGWLYKGHDAVPWCPKCGTAISQHEILTEAYQELTHESVYFKLPIIGREKEYLLVWTTTPWTIPSNVAVAVNPGVRYRGLGVGDELIWFAVDRGEDLRSILVRPATEPLGIDTPKGEKRLLHKLGKELIGWEYEAPFDKLSLVKATLGSYTHCVIDGKDIVTDTEGTGFLHVAPGAGEEDFKLGQENNLPVVSTIEEDASYSEGMGEFSGKNAKVHPEMIIDYLKGLEQGRYFFATQKITHRYPTCWRCKTELVWRVVDEWYIAMDKPSNSKPQIYREQMMEVTKKINWLPKWGKERELDWLKNMHDWLISKKRYWGLALPIWECDKCENFEVIGSRDELQKKAVTGWDKFAGHSPHRPWIDQIKIKCSKCHESISRIPDVGSPWLDAGIVPFSTMPPDWFPADFITESFPGQFKTWFYSLIAMGTALKNTNPFQVVLGFASVLDDKGEEMHKSKGNAIEFGEAADKIGVDVMRWIYSIQNPEQNLNFGYHTADETRRRFYLILWNVYSFFVTYANLDKWSLSAKFSRLSQSANILDPWIITKLYRLVELVTSSLKNYDAMTASRAIEEFVVGDLSGWYIRRSRDRVGPTVDDGQDKDAFYQTCHEVLVKLSKIVAPLMPFIAEEIYQNLTGEESVHLSNWPKENPALVDQSLETAMEIGRKIVMQAHAMRKLNNLKVRQPLSKLSYDVPKALNKDVEVLIAQEINVKQIKYVSSGSKLETPVVLLDLTITPELKAEGQAREIIRQIQEERKKLGTQLDEKVDVIIPNWPVEFEKEILKQTLAKSMTKGSELSIVRTS